MFAIHVPQDTSYASAHIIAAGNIICPQGKHHSKNPLLLNKRGFFDGGAYETRTRDPDTASVVRSQLR